ncbi:MAG: inositol monophosphatase family protein [Jatrophihabitans sp.]|uniref:inositol monophosphatase family protein n=1 Tax=Jatrophihabitans sp. TaxID=1932789 RepID=UPI003F813123
MTDDPPDDRQLAQDLVRDAGTLAAHMLADGLRTEYKTSVTDVVSAADHAAEELVVSRLRSARPDDGIIGEEGTSESGERTWYVDPVDGTYNFLSGLPVWCSALGLVDATGPVLGAVYQPTTDELWVGGPSVPLTLNGASVPALVDRPLGEVSLASYLHPPRLSDGRLREPFLRLVSSAATVRMLGSGSVELASVASGRLGLFVQTDSAWWDWYPGAALVLAAGGAAEVLEHDGHRWLVAGNRQAVADAIALVRG